MTLLEDMEKAFRQDEPASHPLTEDAYRITGALEVLAVTADFGKRRENFEKALTKAWDLFTMAGTMVREGRVPSDYEEVLKSVPDDANEVAAALRAIGRQVQGLTLKCSEVLALVRKAQR